ncbi:hypothetical protein CI610_01300 [invertebrate metagenome]|uniref:DUF962 domain-containing protein n=1 Tax=invertebrate metagenome TaxID=1711999 RepID=A0A2H9T9A9_9ZZZZ
MPLIAFSVLTLTWAMNPWLATGVILLANFFYVFMSPLLAAGMIVFSLLSLWLAHLMGFLIVPLAASIFILTWIVQFVGHDIGGEKPSFFTDLQFLLIGPLWILAWLISTVFPSLSRKYYG